MSNPNPLLAMLEEIATGRLAISVGHVSAPWVPADPAVVRRYARTWGVALAGPSLLNPRVLPGEGKP